MMMGMVVLEYTSIKASPTLNVKIFLYLFLVCLNLFFEIQGNHSKPIIVGVIYRLNSLPHAGINLFLSKILQIHDKILSKNKIAYLMGDYDINLLNVVTHKKQ